MKENKKASWLLEDLCSFTELDTISIETLLVSNGDSSYFIIFLFALISLLPTPLPIPLISMVTGAILCIFAFQLIIGYDHLKLPKKIMNLSVKRETLAGIIEKFNPFLKKIEFFTKFRWLFFTGNVWKTILHIVIFLLAVMVSLPIPFVNTVPAIAIMLISFGLINNDGLLISCGLLLFLCSIALTYLMINFGKAVILYMIRLKKKLFNRL